MLKYYEGMFLFNPAVTSDWDAVQAEITRFMERAEARVIALTKWDERRLAYEIKGCKRGIYALVYFQADASKIGDIERDVQLSESALRCLLIRVDYLTEDEMKLAAEKPASQAHDEDLDGPPRRHGRYDSNRSHRSGGRSDDDSDRASSRGEGTATKTASDDSED